MADTLIHDIAAGTGGDGQAATARAQAPTTYVLRIIATAYLFFLVAWPVSLVVDEHLRRTASTRSARSSRTPTSSHALQLTAYVAVVSVVINTVFGVGISMLLVRYEFPGQAGAQRPDRPAAVGVADRRRPRADPGLQRPHGWFGPTLEAGASRSSSRPPGIIMATVFVALPLVIREVVPVLEEIGIEQEQAATSLGATRRPDVLADHPAVHQVGGRLRRRADAWRARSASSARSRSSPATCSARPAPPPWSSRRST